MVWECREDEEMQVCGGGRYKTKREANLTKEDQVESG